MKKILLLFFLICTTIVFAESYVLKSLFFDEGGKEITSTNYKCKISIGKQFASNVIKSSNYSAVIGLWPFPMHKALPGTQGNELENITNIQFSLSECYPNPVVEQTLIKYSLPIEANVKFQIINTAGRIIKTLINSKQQPGYYKLSWNVKDISQSVLPNGVYFYQFKADNFSATRKIIVLR